MPLTTNEVIELDHEDVKSALLKLLNDLKTYSDKLNTLSGKFGVDNLSDILIWGSREDK